MTNISTSLGQVAYDDQGSGDPVVFLASGGHDIHDYDELRDLLPAKFRTIAIDWPGHGNSPAWPQPPGEAELTRMVEEPLSPWPRRVPCWLGTRSAGTSRRGWRRTDQIS